MLFQTMNALTCRPKRLSSLVYSLGLCSSLTAWVANAVELPNVDAGSVMRQSEQSVKPHLPSIDTLRLLSLPPPMPVNDQIRLHVRRVYFQGNRLLTKGQLYPAVQPYLNRPLNAADVNHLLEAVTNEYRKAGWIVEVYIPHQPLDQNELTLQVVEDVRGSGIPTR
jgi:hemolysin activation/secretion protein